jgi:hypothetical protein
MPVNRKDYLNIFALVFIAIAIFYPIFYSEYAYTDDWFALWQHETQKGIHVLTPYGRYLTDVLTNWLYNSINPRSVHDLIYIRLFSLFGWIVCLPVWYFILKKMVSKENLPGQLTLFATLYIICTLPFTIYVGWASCFEQFIANTTGLISGFVLYSSIKYRDDRIVVPFLAIATSVLFGVISLFTYQNGFGCFLTPFLLLLITRPKSFRRIFIGVGFYLFIYVVYFLLFKYNLKANQLEASARTNIGVDLFPKLKFFFGKPLASAFHFTYLFNERSSMGLVVYFVVFLGWLIADLYHYRFLPATKHLKMVAFILLMLVLVYLPSLIVKETYSSNRTLFALNMAVFFLVATTLLAAIKEYRTRLVVVTMLSVLFVANAYYNFNKQFLDPVKNEYSQVRHFIEKNYAANINNVYFVRPNEDFFVNKYGITRSWDEFGVPSTFFNWVPEFFVKQVILEKTGSYRAAENMTIKQWPDKKQFSDSSHSSQNALIVDVEEILR